MNKINNIFTKENYSYLCQEKRSPLPNELRKKAYLHIPKEKSLSCDNLHKSHEFHATSKFFQRKKAVFNQVMVSNKQLDTILKEISSSNSTKKSEPGTILNLNRKKISDIINIYGEVLKIKETKNEKNQKNCKNPIKVNENLDESSNNITQQPIKQTISEEMRMLREMNHKLVDMVSQKTKKLYGKEKYNQDKAKFLFENSSFFVDLISQLSLKPQKNNENPNKQLKNLLIFKERNQKTNAIRHKSVTFHAQSNKKHSKKEENPRNLVEIQEVLKDLPQVVVNEASNEPYFNEISSKPSLDFSRFHTNSALNSAFLNKNKRKDLSFREFPTKKLKEKRGISTELPAISKEIEITSEKKPKPLEKLTEMREILKGERSESKKLRAFLRKKQRNFSLGLEKISKKIDYIL